MGFGRQWNKEEEEKQKQKNKKKKKKKRNKKRKKRRRGPKGTYSPRWPQQLILNRRVYSGNREAIEAKKKQISSTRERERKRNKKDKKT